MNSQFSIIIGGSDSFASSYNTIVLRSSARPVRASDQYAHYDFIAILGLAQRLHVSFLPITWQAARGLIGMGGQAKISQSQITPDISFAFKIFSNQRHATFAEIAQEIAMLRHPVVREHEHLATLEGICWDIQEDNQVWPVLVFQQSHLGDLHGFSKLERFKNLLIEDKLDLCADIGIAIRDMHHNGIIHGDIKPQNVLVFESDARIIAKVADFGFATYSQSHNHLIVVPKSEPWNAPEHHHRLHEPKQAQQMDMYSFNMVCFWLIFEAGSPGTLQPLPQKLLERGQYFSFERCHSEKNLLLECKSNRNEMLEWIEWLINGDQRLNGSLKDSLSRFFGSTVHFDPALRDQDLRRSLGVITPKRVLPQAETVQVDMRQNQEDFKIVPSIHRFYAADFRLREYIVQCLKCLVTEPAESATQRISPPKAALQLALSYSIGFGTSKDDNAATLLLDQYSIKAADLQTLIQSIKDGTKIPLPGETLYERLYSRHQIRKVDLSDNYRERRLLERAEAAYKREIESLHLVFGKHHSLPLLLMFWLARVFISQGQWEAAAELETQVLETEENWLGNEDSNTLRSRIHLAIILGVQGRRNEAEKLAKQAVETGSKVLGPKHPDTLVSLGLLALLYRHQGQLDEAEKVETQVMESYRSSLGAEHTDTLISQSNLAAIFREQSRWEESEQLYLKILESNKRIRGAEHPEVSLTMRDLASTYRSQGRLLEAEELNLQALEALEKVLGPEHPDTLTCQSNLAVTYYKQGRLGKAEELNLQVLEVSMRLLGPKHPDTLITQNNMVSIFLKQGKVKEAQQLQSHATEAAKGSGNAISLKNRVRRWWKPQS